MKQDQFGRDGADRDLRPVDELTTLLAATPREQRVLLHAIVLDNREQAERCYRNHLTGDPDILALATDDSRADEMAAGFMNWILNITDPDLIDIDGLARQQQQSGEMLARIGFPPHAISSSLRKTKLWFIEHLAHQQLSRERLVSAVRYIVSLIDLSLELRQTGYQHGLSAQSRVDEAYRIYSLGQNLAMERERQRALLMEWGHRLLSSFYRNGTRGGLPRLWKSDFGLWVNHKGLLLFDRDELQKSVICIIDRVDSELVPTLEQASPADAATISTLAQRIEEELGAIKFGLNSLFEKHLEIENGRDPLTQLLNRRFMPSVLTREIQLQKNADVGSFCVLLVDVDHFKQVNDQHGHGGGDLALQQVTRVIAGSVNPCDFVFRYGGEEIALVLVDCGLTAGMQVGERIRRNIEQLAVKLSQGQQLHLTVSIGVAEFAGELDYEALIQRADSALYQAKTRGRNQVVSG